MALFVHGIRFEGGFSDPGELEPRSGVSVVWCLEGGTLSALDVGEAVDIRARVSGHDRKECWESHCRGVIRYSAHYMDGASEQSRGELEGHLRRTEKPPCGER